MPSSVADTLYGPGGSDFMLKIPASSVTAVRCAPVSVFFTTTETPGIAAPLSAVTIPLISPSTWASSPLGASNASATSRTTPRRRGHHDMMIDLQTFRDMNGKRRRELSGNRDECARIFTGGKGRCAAVAVTVLSRITGNELALSNLR